jgi:ATP-dependent DNA helicase RecQ
MARNNILNKELYEKGIKKLGGVLERMGYESLRPGQDEAIHSILGGRDVICFMPTSFGKSAIYQIPTTCLGWNTLVFSPLLSLIQDQVEKLQDLGMTAGQVSSNQSEPENNLTLSDWELGELNFLFAAPEKLANERFIRTMTKRKPDMVVIDEAHCISSWGTSFRPSYQDIGMFVNLFKPTTVLAMTATKTEEVEKDIRSSLGIDGSSLVSYFPKRENLSFKSSTFSMPALTKIINDTEGSIIIYSASIKETESLFNHLRSNIKGGATIYHGAMGSAERTSNQSTFMGGRVRVMFATKAFGMGIDKRDIRCIVHKGYTSSLEDYAQETGRAGRDGKPSVCWFLYDESSISTQRWFIENQYPPKFLFNKIFEYVNKRKDKHGSCQVLISEVAKVLNVHDSSVNACLNIMAQAGVVERKKTSGKLFKAKLLKEHINTKFADILEAIANFGIMGSDGFYEADLEIIATTIGIKSTTLRTKLRNLDKDGYIIFVPPFRGVPTKVLSDLSKIDFDSLKNKAALELSKLNHIKDFIDCLDKDKGAFLHNYFA